MKSKVCENKKKTTKWQRFATNLKISRIFLALVCLALLKLTVIGVMGVESLTQSVPEQVVQTVAEVLPDPEPKVAMAAENKDAKKEEAPKKAPAEDVAPPPDWKALKKKEEQLAAKERNLLELEAGIKSQLAELEKLRGEIKKMLDEAQGTKDKKVLQLINMLASTKAKKAAEILENMDEDLAVKVLSGMNGRKAGEILSYVGAKKAAKLSEALTTIQLPFEN